MDSKESIGSIIADAARRHAKKNVHCVVQLFVQDGMYYGSCAQGFDSKTAREIQEIKRNHPQFIFSALDISPHESERSQGWKEWIKRVAVDKGIDPNAITWIE